MFQYALTGSVVYRLNEKATLGLVTYCKGDVISHDTLLALMQTYAELDVTIISIM